MGDYFIRIVCAASGRQLWENQVRAANFEEAANQVAEFYGAGSRPASFLVWITFLPRMEVRRYTIGLD